MAGFRFSATDGKNNEYFGKSFRRGWRFMLLLNKRFMTGLLTFTSLVLFLTAVAGAGIATTKHNLSLSGPGTVKSEVEERVCVFCHTPHHAISSIDGINVPLWNHTLSAASYQLFSSPTLLSPTSPAIQPDGSSRLCLSCHDGTVAIGSVVNSGDPLSVISMIGTGSGGVMPGEPGAADSPNEGTDLSGQHPISIELNGSLIVAKAIQCQNNLVSFKVCSPPAGSPVKLEKTNNRYGGVPSGVGVQCGSCHDPHEDPVPGSTVFLRVGDRISHAELCNACHSTNCAAACP